MASFKDSMGREWHININVAAMRRARAKDIDLSMAIKQLNQFVMDDVFLVDALYAICKPDLDSKGISLEQFEAAFDGVVTEKAREALWAALEGYYDTGKGKLLRAAIEMVKAELSKAADTLSDLPDFKAN